ncbi:hypothetical protein [Haloplanus halobius]|nr:hypothetical protein [Haloplanus sp. XH21]
MSESARSGAASVAIADLRAPNRVATAARTRCDGSDIAERMRGQADAL